MKAKLGYLLIAVALLILGFTYSPLVKEEVSFQVNNIKNKNNPKEIIPIDNSFGLVIPKLGINVKVIKNVDPFNSIVYQEALTRGVAHAKGSSLPGQAGNVFIFSHSSQNFIEALKYNSIFYLISKLKIGDEIDIFYDNNEYRYHVTDKKIVDPTNISYLNNNSKDKTLTLMTCYPPGTNFMRYIITAR
jgi:sortase A